jgi:hypothetical protein
MPSILSPAGPEDDTRPGRPALASWWHAEARCDVESKDILPRSAGYRAIETPKHCSNINLAKGPLLPFGSALSNHNRRARAIMFFPTTFERKRSQNKLIGIIVLS